MSTELAKYEPNDYAALDAAIGSDIDGEPLRFKDGKFYSGFDKLEVADGTVFRVAPSSVQDGFVKWEDGKPTDWRLREWCNSSQLPVYRETLGDTDKNEWPDGKDPWAYTMLLAMKDAEGKFYKFSTGSAGGSNAVRKLLRGWKRDRNKRPGLVPVVAISSDFYVHKVHHNRFPVFDIVGWEPWDENFEALPPPDDQRTQIAQELNDAIPF